MNQDALRTAIALYRAGTIDDAGAARYLGVTPVGWETYRRLHGIRPMGTIEKIELERSKKRPTNP